MTYNQAYDKIIDAYFIDEIKPMDSRFCFCGTLHGNDDWNLGWYKDSCPYSLQEYKRMEKALFDELVLSMPDDVDEEDALFKGMCAALEVLKQIHIERGEDVEEKTFTKRIKTAIYETY